MGMSQSQRTTLELCICALIITICAIYTTQTCEFGVTIPKSLPITLPKCRPSKLEGQIRINWERFMEHVRFLEFTKHLLNCI